MGLLRWLGSLSAGGRGLLGGIAVLILAAGSLGFLAWRTGHTSPIVQPVAPRVVALVTDKSEAVATGDLVPSGTPLKLTFNTPMKPGTVALTANGTQVALSWAHDGRSAALDTGALKIGPVALAVGRGGRSAGGGQLPPWSLAFSSIFAARVHTVPLATPVLVQVPNDPAARDQSGLQSAAIVYEYLTEGGITRFTAIFVNAPDEIGPVRSGRLISFALTRRYRGLLMASGLSEGSNAVLAANPVPHVFDNGAGYFHRTTDRRPPNNLYTSASEVQRALASASLPPFSLPEAEVPIRSGPAGTAIDVPEHSSTYTFDAATRTYTKQVDGRTLIDAATGQPLHIQLAVVIHTTATSTGYVEDVNGQPGLDIDVQAGGRADFWFDGLQASGRWSSPSASAPLRFELDSGAVVRPPALTWVDVVTS
jgi:hypothetical protein